jgi:hypothetical protein
LIADNFADDFRVARCQMLQPETRLPGTASIAERIARTTLAHAGAIAS